MKIAIAGGHSKAAPGASGYLDEYECDRTFVAQLIPALEAAGHQVVNCTNEAATSNAELNAKVRLANNSGADVFLDIHFNSGIQVDTDETTGTECFYFAGNERGRKLANAMSANVAAALGVKNRGGKTAKYYVLRNTSMTAVLLEVCFVDDKDDAAHWHATSWDALTKAVVDAFGDNPSSAHNSATYKPVVTVTPVDDSFAKWVGELQAECNAQGFSNQKVDKIPGPVTLAGCPTLGKGSRGNITKLVQMRLIALGYSCGRYGADGVNGDGTQSAIRAFQSANGIEPTGRVNQATWRKLLGL